MNRKQLQIGFVVEHALGHITHAQALEREVASDGGIAAEWMRIPESAEDVFEHLPGLPFSLKVSLRARRRILARLRRGPLDALFIHTQALTPACMDLIASVPSVVSLDATPLNFSAIATGYGERAATGLRGALKTAVFRRVFARARALVTMSSWARDSLARDYGVDPSRITVVPPGIDVSAWVPRDRSTPARGPLRLLFVGGDFERKGGPVLMEAFRHGLADRCEIDVVTRDERVAQAPGVRVHRGLTPNAPALRKLFTEADLFVLPSRGDFSPFALLEAMACGLPVVATDVGAIGEMVRDGVNGRLVPVGDAAALAQCVRELAADVPRLEAMGRVARSDAQQRFDARRNYPRLVAVIRDTAGQPA